MKASSMPTKTATGDELFGFFDGSLTHWSWKLLGKKEIYIPANNYEPWQIDSPPKKECPPLSLSPERIRYELRRVWVVEMVPKEGYRHPYSRRMRYHDEDNWDCTTYENYDHKGELVTFGEKFTAYDYCTQLVYWTGSTSVNLKTGHYHVAGGNLNNKAKMLIYNSNQDPKDFTLAAFKRAFR